MPNFRPVLLLLLYCLPAGIMAQESDIFPPARRQALREEIVFERPEEAREEETDTDTAAPAWDLSSYPAPLLGALSVLVAAGLGFLLYRIYRDLNVKSGNRNEAMESPTAVTLSEQLEEDLVQSGIPPDLLARAEAAGQYAVAVRLSYLGLLHGLTQSGLIRYRRDFSNRDYAKQLTGHPLREDFEAATRLYERYWYGSHPIDRLSYRVVRQSIAGLHTRLPQLPQTALPDE